MENPFKLFFARFLHPLVMVLGPGCSGELLAQLPQFEWVGGMRSGSNGNLTDMAVDQAGHVYSVGYFSSQAVFGAGPTSVSLNSSGMEDGFIQKLD
ncbi:MAG TPA: hypothetical protein PLU53_15695, partial [Bacteroidia bacterium]|nr:hypothetical protein [Bacteroidia bacterium]